MAAASRFARLRNLAPRAGFEPATNRLTAGCSTTELPGNNAANSGGVGPYNTRSPPCKAPIPGRGCHPGMGQKQCRDGRVSVAAPGTDGWRGRPPRLSATPAGEHDAGDVLALEPEPRKLGVALARQRLVAAGELATLVDAFKQLGDELHDAEPARPAAGGQGKSQSSHCRNLHFRNRIVSTIWCWYYSGVIVTYRMAAWVPPHGPGPRA